MTSWIEEAVAFPITITQAALKIGTSANAVATIALVGTIAQQVNTHQALLDAIFGQSRGPMIAMICAGISYYATILTAHGQPLNASGTSLANVLSAPAPAPMTQTTIVNPPITEEAPVPTIPLVIPPEATP